jgi:dihydrofolate reductase
MCKPVISLIAALDRHRCIGKGNRLPWHLPADLQHFKRLTLDKPIVMGRKTWESLPGLLPRRPHIVISRDPRYRADGCVVVDSVDAALAAAGDVDEIMVVGGAQVYRLMLPLARRMYLTFVDTSVDGDARFPAWDEAQWAQTAVESHPADERNPFDYRFVTLERAGQMHGC